MKNEHILVTGTYGFIGSWYVKLLIKNGYEPVGLGRRTVVGDKRRLEEIDKSKYKDYEGDICDNKLMKSIIKENDIDTIVNFAASTHVDNSIRNSEPFIHSNYVGVWNILEVIKENKEKGKNIRMIQISTDECYGSILEGSFKERDRLNPGNPYSATKTGADLLCLSYINTYELDICITRSSNNYGPWQHEEKLIPRMIKLAMQGKDLEIYGDGKNIRDWLYVDDNCRAIKLVMEKGVKGEIYNIGAGNEKNNNDVAKIISERFNVPIKYVKDRPGHDYRYSIDSSKIRNIIGWNPAISFEEGIEETIRHYSFLK